MRIRLLARALVVYFVALILRFRNLREVIVGDRVLFGYEDPYYHLRRVLLTLEYFPRVPDFDYYTNFPQGARITWPPGFDLLVAAVSWLVGFGNPSRHRVEVTAAVLVPFLGAVTAVVVLLLAEEIFGRGRWEAFASALLFAFLPAQQAISTVGRLDHHVVEMTAFGTAVLFFLRALRDDPGSRYSFWGGFALAAGIFCWTGSILYAGFLAFFGIAQMILDRIHRRPDAGTGRSALRVLFWGALLTVPLVLVAPGDGKTSFTFLLLSWYQPALIGVAAFLIPSLSGAIFAPSGGRGWIRLLRGFLVSGLLAAAGAWIVVRGSAGLEFLSRRDPVISVLVESRPAWKLPPGQLAEYFSYHLYLVPLAAVALARIVVRARFFDVRHNTLLALFLFTAALGVSQARFLNYFAVPFCIVLMWGFRTLMEATARRFSSRPFLRAGAALGGAALLVVPLGPTLRTSFRSLPGNVSAPLAYLYPSLEWLRDRTPKTSYYLEPEREPEYGVLAGFTLGHWITAIGERPNFCNPFSLAPWHEKPIFESARLFLTEEEEPVAAQMDRNRLRYVLLYSTESAIPDYSRLAGLPPEDYLDFDRETGRALPTARFFHTFGVRLALADGSEYQAAGGTVPALSGFRLVHESPETHWRVVPGLSGPIQASRVKIFERVKGGQIRGMADPGGEVVLRILVTTDAGRDFEYLAHGRAGEDGIFSLGIPYAAGASGSVLAAPARIATSRCTLEVAFSEEEILGGAGRSVRCP